MIDIHVHPFIPVLRGLCGTWLHHFDLNAKQEGNNIFCVSFYELCIPSRKWANRRLFDHIESFVKQNQPNIVGTVKGLTHFTGSFLKGGDGKNSYILGIESLRPITNLDQLEQLKTLGVRYLQPVHFWDNDFAHSYRMGIFKPSEKGLNDFGRELLGEMERLDLIMDITHMNVASMEDVLSRFSGPIMCSHTGLGDVKATTRNISRDVAVELFKRKGLVGVTPWRKLLGKASSFDLHSWAQAFCRTVLSFVKLGGEKGIAVGSDRGAPLYIHPNFFTEGNLKRIRETLLAEGLTDIFFEDLLEGNALDFFKRALPN
jgi:microsomal dipeptidase-like Zn-dependent dipeptidase